MGVRTMCIVSIKITVAYVEGLIRENHRISIRIISNVGVSVGPIHGIVHKLGYCKIPKMLEN